MPPGYRRRPTGEVLGRQNYGLIVRSNRARVEAGSRHPAVERISVIAEALRRSTRSSGGTRCVSTGWTEHHTATREREPNQPKASKMTAPTVARSQPPGS